MSKKSKVMIFLISFSVILLFTKVIIPYHTEFKKKNAEEKVTQAQEARFKVIESGLSFQDVATKNMTGYIYEDSKTGIKYLVLHSPPWQLAITRYWIKPEAKVQNGK